MLREGGHPLGTPLLRGGGRRLRSETRSTYWSPRSSPSSTASSCTASSRQSLERWTTLASSCSARRSERCSSGAELRPDLAAHGRDPLHYDLEPLALASERLTGAELEQVVGAALYAAFSEGRELDDADLARAVEETVPLYDTYEERIKELRDWSRGRARPASVDARIANLFSSAGTR